MKSPSLGTILELDSISSAFKKLFDNEEYSFMTTDNSDFILNVTEMERLSDSECLIVPNSPTTKLSNYESLVIARSLLLKKPILTFHPLYFAPTVAPILKELITRRFYKIILCNLGLFEAADARYFVRNIATGTTNYTLTKHEITLIRSITRAHFRNLVARN